MQHFHDSTLTFMLSLVFLTTQLYTQNIDRSVLSNAYSTSEMGTWVLGETVIGDLTSLEREVTIGFLQGDVLSTGIRAYSDPDFTFKAYPNPFLHIFHIRHDSPSPLTLEIRDIAGQIIYFHNQIATETSIDLLDFTPGTYILKYLTKDSGQGVLPIFKVQ